jgi:hypothetical protein
MSTVARPVLTDMKILLLLDNCIVKARQCQEREFEAEALGQYSRAEYLRKLRAHYHSVRAALEEEIFERGVNESELAQRLAKLDRRSEVRTNLSASSQSEAAATED